MKDNSTTISDGTSDTIAKELEKLTRAFQQKLSYAGKSPRDKLKKDFIKVIAVAEVKVGHKWRRIERHFGKSFLKN